MLLLKPSTEIVHITPNALELIEQAGRTCYKSEERITAGSAEKFVAALIKSGHESVLEHAMATVRFVCDRGVSHELVRHRLNSFSQESTRYCDYEDGHVAFVIPPWCIGIKPGVISPGNFEAFGDKIFITTDEHAWATAAWASESSYKTLRNLGWKPEKARSVLINSLKTEIVISGNLRQWRHFFKVRAVGVAGRPHPQMLELTVPLLAEFKKRIPVMFDDINPKEA